MGCKNLEGTSCKRDDKFRILNPVLVALPQMIPQTLVLPPGSVPIVDLNRTNEIIKQTLDKFWSDVNTALTDENACADCKEELFIEVSMIDLMFDGKKHTVHS